MTTPIQLSAIVAVGLDGSIGQAGGLPWGRLQCDRKWFREHTWGRSVIMGRKTWESLPTAPLGGRHNIVLTRQWPGASGPVWGLGCSIAKTPEEAIQIGTDFGRSAVVIGGAQIYRLFMPHLTRILIAHIFGEFPEADKFFPLDDLDEGWTAKGIHPGVAEEGEHMVTFYEYTRVAQTAEVVG